MKNTGLVLLAALLLPLPGWAESKILRVAVFPFDSQGSKDTGRFMEFVKRVQNEAVTGGGSDPIILGDKITALLSASLSGNPAVELVERAQIDKAFDELALGKTGLVDETRAAQIGRLVGAQVLVTGKAFPLDEELYIVAKVVGVETSRAFAAKASGPLTGKLAPLVETLSGQVSKVLLTHDEDLVGRDVVKKDPVAQITAALGAATRPVVTVQVVERHGGREGTDPAVETEMLFLLQKSGFQVIDQRNPQLADWAQSYLEDSRLPVPRSTRAQVVIVGEAYSEFAARRGDLVSCKARVELRALDVKTGQILAIERKTQTAVDIAEISAAKTALQEATQDLAVSLIPPMTTKWKAK